MNKRDVYKMLERQALELRLTALAPEICRLYQEEHKTIEEIARALVLPIPVVKEVVCR